MKYSKNQKKRLDVLLHILQNELPEDRLAHVVKTAWISYSRVLQMGLMEHSVSFGHWVFLRILWDKEGITQKELSLLAGVVEPTTHSALRMMENLGYIDRRKAVGNKKNIYIYLTRKGKELKKNLIPLTIEINEIALCDISEEDIIVTRRSLLKVIKNLSEFEKKCAEHNKTMPSTRELISRIKKDVPIK